MAIAGAGCLKRSAPLKESLSPARLKFHNLGLEKTGRWL